MNRKQYDEQYEHFVQMAHADGRFAPLQKDQVPVLDEDSPSHTGRDYCWDYLFHCGWAARVLAQTKPEHHVDIGSYVYFAALCSAWIPHFDFLDVRELNCPLEKLHCMKGDITWLPFRDDSLESVSCLHVLEHIGLGRYGDRLDAQGDIKAAKELIRVLKPGGKLLMVLPMNETPRVNFNAHRIYSYDQAIWLFLGMCDLEFTVLQNEKIHRCDNQINLPTGDYTGCMVLTK